MENRELKPCPFCGGDEVRFTQSWASSVVLIYCPTCTAVVSFGGNKRDTYKYSAEAWNRRGKHIRYETPTGFRLMPDKLELTEEIERVRHYIDNLLR